MAECCTDGCQEDGAHKRTFTVAGGWGGGGEVEAEAWFCCKHLDLLDEQGPGFLDLHVKAVERDRG